MHIDLSILLTGLAAVPLTWVGKKATQAVAGADSHISGAYKTAQPIIAGALGLILPTLCAKIGLISTCPDAATLTAAPLGTLLGISLLEGTRKLTQKIGQ